VGASIGSRVIGYLQFGEESLNERNDSRSMFGFLSELLADKHREAMGMRYLAAKNAKHSPPIALVTMRGKYDCMTCVTAMLLGIEYEEVEQAFGGNLDPTKGQEEEITRLHQAFFMLLEKHRCSVIQLASMPFIAEGRRYWVGVKIHDPSNALSQRMGHSIVIDESGKVFDPNPQYGVFLSLKQWQAAMTLPHELEHATEVFEYVL
jgi:hypothetical protein